MINKQEINKEVFDLITEKMSLRSIPFTKDFFGFAFDMFLEGVNFIPNKTAPVKSKLGEREK